jgi:hypothetical protein
MIVIAKPRMPSMPGVPGVIRVTGVLAAILYICGCGCTSWRLRARVVVCIEVPVGNLMSL